MNGFLALLWQEWIMFRRKFWLVTTSALISPALYLIAFGWGVSRQMSSTGHGSYLAFMLPGLLGMTSMLSSYSATSSQVSISRVFYGTFESLMIAPIRSVDYVAGKTVAGALQGLYVAGLLVVTMAVARVPVPSAYGVLVLVLNALVFASLGCVAGLVLNSHAAISRFSSFVITPMSFLCGTFFSVSALPHGVRELIWTLPLTHTNQALRAGAETRTAGVLHIAVLAAYLVALSGFAIHRCRTTE